MPFFGNKVQEKTTVIGTSAPYTVGQATNAIPGWKTWRSMPNLVSGGQVGTFACNDDESIWEYCYGNITLGPPDTITRSFLLSSTGALIDWQATDTVYVYSTPWAQALEGRYDGTNGFFVHANRRPYTAVGAANKSFATSFRDDVGGRFSVDNSAAARTFTLPAISGVGMGWTVDIFGLSQANYVNLAPTGSDVIDYGTGGQALPLPGRVRVSVWSDGLQWRTDIDYSSAHVLILAQPSAATTTTFTGLPYWVNNLTLDFSLLHGTTGTAMQVQISASGSFITSGYAYLTSGQDTAGTNSTSSGGSQPCFYTGFQAMNNTIRERGNLTINDIKTSQFQYSIARSYGVNQAGNGTLGNMSCWSSTAVVDGIRCFMGSGTHTGEIRLIVTG